MSCLKIICGAMGATFFLKALSANASEEGDIERLVRGFYLQNEKSLQCRNKDGAVDTGLIKIPQNFFSKNFMMHYRAICLGEVDFVFAFDIRTADNEIYLYEDSKASFSNLRIGAPSIIGNRATVTVVYDLDKFPFKDWGNFTKLKMVKQGGDWKIDDIELGGEGKDRESITSLLVIKSLKKYIDENIKKSSHGKTK